MATGSLDDPGGDDARDDEPSGARSAADESGAIPKAAADDERFPRMLGERYRLEALIAKGGMGKVYRASQLPLEREVAVKLMVAPPAAGGEFRRRFLLEASICARLKHPNIVIVHDYGETELGELYMTMELLDGEPLKELQKREGPLRPLRAIRIALQIARALRAAHGEGVAHRDLKPGNVFVDRQLVDDEHEVDAVKVLDFGLVKVYEGERSDPEEDVTGEDVMLGSPRYMSPEQILCEPVDARSDIYSFGALLFSMLAGRPPFVGQNSMEILSQHLQRPAPPVGEALAELEDSPEWAVPASLEAVVRRCLAKEVDDRFQSVDELIVALKEVRTELEGGTGRFGALVSDSGLGPPTDLAAPRAPARRGWVAPVALLAVAAVAVGWALTRGSDPEVSQEPPAGAIEPEAEAEPEPESEPQAPEAPVETDIPVTVTSEPPGAAVISGGVLLGRTPLTRRLPPTPEGAQRMLELRLEGFEPARANRAITGDSVEIHVALTAVEPEVEAPEPRRRRRARRRPSMSPTTDAMRTETVDERELRIPIVD